MRFLLTVIVMIFAISGMAMGTPSEFSFGHDEQMVMYYLKGMRGFWYGFYRGFFHEGKKPHEKCLNDEAADEISSVLQFMAYGELSDVFTVADAVSSLYYDNKQFCGEQEIFQGIMDKCYGHQAEQCTFKTMMKNIFTTHLMEVFGACSVLTNAVMEFSFRVDADVFAEQLSTIGKNLGLLLATTYGV